MAAVPPATASSAAASAPVAAAATAAPVPATYPTLQAEAASELKGVQTQDTEDQGGGKNVGWIAAGDALRFDGVDFGTVAPAQLEMRVASDAEGGEVEVRVDAADAPPIGTLSVTRTGGWQSWRTDVADLKPVTGKHTLYLTFARPDGGEFININWLHLAR